MNTVKKEILVLMRRYCHLKMYPESHLSSESWRIGDISHFRECRVGGITVPRNKVKVQVEEQS